MEAPARPDTPPVGDLVGFIGLGIMGQPMALNLAAAGTPLIVWNRSAASCEPLRAAGAEVAATPGDVFTRARTVFIMLINEAATDAVLGRGAPSFTPMVSGRTLVCMGSNAPDYSRALAADVRAAGGAYVEAPVSGSRKPAENGSLVGLLAGEPEDIAPVLPLFQPMCRVTVNCGSIGNGLLMKLSVNLFLNQMLVALAEAAHFAERNGLDLRTFQQAIDAGPMASDVTHVKLSKLVARDFAAQAAMSDALNSERLIKAAAEHIGMASPLLDAGRQLYGEGVAAGDGDLDMVAVIRAIEARTERRRAAHKEARAGQHDAVRPRTTPANAAPA